MRKPTPRQAIWLSIGTGVLGLCCCGGVIGALSGEDGGAGASVVPSSSRAPSPSFSPSPSSTPSSSPVVVVTPAAPAADQRYATCEEVLAAGLGPYREGVDPEYVWYFDRDGDGVVCEAPPSNGSSTGGGPGDAAGGPGDAAGGPGDSGGSAVYFENCAAARAAGAAPVHHGQPGYGTHLDRDRDGVGCE
ncbi:excalibur calcium-binding domain-containing protein [Catenuloplanes atrovinosus]|uniref:Excalibur calcium-binding domain-containing protein n=1 Tax=Catenuloplanes atrovinosus TaxID=137266 RepID=A0AAE4C9I7_9ACTN|nr:excalibur calcium-binding domain-containing protein [Catenuloplanes atrovinosus]MDR7274844.1 hypothetical protein [Catenuloplanes atrovinosus]